MNQKPLITLKLLAFFFYIQNLSAVCQNVSQEQQIDQIFAEWNKAQTPGASVAIVKDGRIIFKKGYGSANLEHNIPNNPSTVFEIASVSKQFTAFAMLLLENQGKLSLDDDVRKFIPELPDYGKVITLKHLLYHTSGIRDEMDLLCMAGWRYDDVITHEQIINLTCRQKELNFPPGAEYQYSNTGYTLLAEVVSRISGQSFADFTRDHIFKPLGMTSTLVRDNYEQIVSNLAYSYYDDDNVYKKNVLSSANIGASSLLTTVEDLSLWAMNFEYPIVGSKNLIQKMNERGTLNHGETISYALGQDVNQYKGLTIIDHAGAVAGYRSLLVRFPEQHFSVILLSNNASFDTQGTAIKIAEVFLKDQFVAEKPVEAAPPPTGEKEFNGDPELIATYAGKYELRPEFIINITSENEKLFVEAHEVPLTRLFQVSPTEFTIPAMNARLTFAPDNAGEVNQIDIVLNGQPMTAKKLKTFDATTLNPDEYNGNFFSPELGTVYTFVTKNGQLVARHARLGDFEMTAVNPDQFSTDKRFLKRIEFTRNEKNVVTGCLAWGGRISNIKFEKID
jgi:CubicO group peptidase (beta-lactamase class C family)